MKRILSGLIFGCFACSSLHAASPAKLSNWHYLAEVGAGAAWASAGEVQTFYLTPSIEKSYRPTKNNTRMASGYLFFGAEKLLASRLLAQIGVVLATTSNADVDGIIWDDADPQFNNHSYHYKVKNTRLGLHGKVLLSRNLAFMPYIGGSVNLAFNRSYDFSNSPLILPAIVNPNYQSRTQTAFSYTLNAGIQAQIDKHWRAGIGYEFLDFGHSELGRAPGQSINSGLSLSHLYAHQVLASISYVA